MASGHPGEAVRQINRLFRDGTAAALTDGQLLERFATRRPEAAEAAFEALVNRHGPMVLRVCRGVLRDPHDVEDAFQATFLVLVRKAHAIGERDLLANWLYGVAHRVALKARGVASRRNKREGGLMDDPPADPAAGPWLDLGPVLHEELDRLPDKYRKPVVLCHLQGMTHAEAAQELAWPVGTVSVRLARARTLLKERLARRGLTATASTWLAGLGLEGASAVVPESLLRSTAKAALAASSSKILAAGTVSAGALALTKRTLTTMLITRLPLKSLFVLILGVAGGMATMRFVASRSNDEARTARVARRDLTTPPPGTFDLAPLAARDESGPAPVQKGQMLIIEALEALPGRPITGERIVRPDGTIGLGFYGDVEVAGLNRKQIKVKVLEHLRKWLNDETLGLVVQQPDGKTRLVPPVDSDRIFVDEVDAYRSAASAPAKVPPVPKSGRSPFDLGDDPAAADNNTPPSGFEESPVKLIPPVVATNRGRGYEIDPASEHFFDLPSADSSKPTIKPGQFLQVEVLEALPGRPITGERVVRPDGTISLGFYGDLKVAGLHRDQVKVKLIEQLRKWINDETLGLILIDNDNTARAAKPIDSNRVFIDESANYLPQGVDRPKVRARMFDPFTETVKNGRLDVIEGWIHRVVKEMNEVKATLQAPKAGDPEEPGISDAELKKRSDDERKRKNGSERLDFLVGELYKALKEVEDLKAEGQPAEAKPADPGQPATPPATKPPG